MKRSLSFSILQRQAGMLIFTYDVDDSPEFRPTFKHFFDLSDAKFLEWSPLSSSFLCVRDKVLSVMMVNDPSFKELELKHLVNKKITSSGFSPQGNFIFLVLAYQNKKDRYKLEFREAETGKIRKAIRFTWKYGITNLVYTSLVLKWGFDDSYVALIADEDVVHVYETKTFTRFTRFEKIQDFSWSPSALTLALFGDCTVKFAEISSGRVLLDIPGLEGVNIYRPLWHSTGHYLACICGTGNSFNKILVVSLKSGMFEYITPPSLGDDINLAWNPNPNPNGNEFAISFGTNDGQHYETTWFYTIQENNGECLSRKTKTLEGIEANSLNWSPNGRYMVFIGREMLCFYDVENHQQLALVEHSALYVDWDPSSRFLLSYPYFTKLFCDKALHIWSPRGEKLIRVGSFSFGMRWCHKESCATGSSMLIDDGDDKDTTGNSMLVDDNNDDVGAGVTALDSHVLLGALCL